MDGWRRRVGVALLACLVLGVAGCGGGSGPRTGNLYLFIAWPALGAQTRAGFAQMRSVKVELFSGGASLLTRVQNRLADVGQSQILLPDLALGSYRFLVTAYDGADAGGAMLGQASGIAAVAGTLTPPVYLTTVRQLGATLTVSPEHPTVYVTKSVALSYTVRNVDNAYVLSAPGTIQWSSADPAIASVHPFTGVATGVEEGQVEITASDGATLTGRTTVAVRYEPPTVTLTVDDDRLDPGESAKLSWTSTHADRVDSAVNFSTTLLNGSLTVWPVETTTYTIAVSGKGGTASDSVTVTVVYPAPSLTLTASRADITAGEAVTLSWNSTYATAVVLAEHFTTQAIQGSLTVYPAQTTTYRLTVRGPGGDTTASATVTVASGLVRWR
ncbi:MAG TPA: Ig-like domain-containing protein [Armatimonadota bacterium]|nr:Ig-like domain-containing protein [Armatimonadota bacterium]